MPKSIACIGFDIPGDDADSIPFLSKVSLFDYDIAIIDTNIGNFNISYSNYRGKPSLDDYRSFQLKDHLEHWRQELLESLKSGKTIFVLLNHLQEIYVATGTSSHSGTGRNRTTTRHIELYDNYRLIPGDVKFRASNGHAMRLSETEKILATYCADFLGQSEYRVLIDSAAGTPMVFTRTGRKAVGTCLRYTNMSGALYLLPYFDFDADTLTYEKEEKEYWTDEALQLGKRFIAAIVGIDKATRESGETTPPPTWLTDTDNYMLPAEKRLRSELLRIATKIETLQSKKDEIQGKLATETVLKGLLYEKGKPLEASILAGIPQMATPNCQEW